MRKLLGGVLVVCALAAPAAASERRVGAQVLSTQALAGPAATETRLAWVHARNPKCTWMAVRDAATLRHHDLGTPICDVPPLTVAIAAWGAGVGLWTTTTCGNDCYETVHVVGRRGRHWGAAPDSLNTGGFYGYDYQTYPLGDGKAVAAADGSDTALVYSVLHREILDPKCPDPDASCAVTITGGALWSFVAGHWRKLPAPWPVSSLDVSGHSIAIAEAGGPEVEIRDVQTWKLERRYSLPGVQEVALSPRFVALRSATTVVSYTRPGGGLYVRRHAPMTEATKSTPQQSIPRRTLAVSDRALAFGTVAGGAAVIDIVRRDGRTSTIPGDPVGLVVTRSRITWRTDQFVYSQVLAG